jgi:hypothetical protein
MSFADVFLIDLAVASPFALLVYWRTLVHGRRFQLARPVGFQALVEAGATGVFTAGLFVYPVLLRMWTAWLILALGAGIGVIVGLFLQSIAILCLRDAEG